VRGEVGGGVDKSLGKMRFEFTVTVCGVLSAVELKKGMMRRVDKSSGKSIVTLLLQDREFSEYHETTSIIHPCNLCSCPRFIEASNRHSWPRSHTPPSSASTAP